MPERLNFVALLEAVDESAIRSELVERLRSSLSDWIGAPSKVFLLGVRDGKAQEEAWDGATSLKARTLSDDELLFADFACPQMVQDQYVGVLPEKRCKGTSWIHLSGRTPGCDHLQTERSRFVTDSSPYGAGIASRLEMLRPRMS